MIEQPRTDGSTLAVADGDTLDGPGHRNDVDRESVDRESANRENANDDEFDGDQVVVALRQLDPDLPPPSYAHAGDAGADLRAAADVTLAPGARALVGTGVAIALPRGYAGFVHPRSGLAARHGVSIVNAPGTVDADYRGEILVCLINVDSQTPVTISRGDRIAQLVVQPVSRARFVAVTELPTTVRGSGGHGSTGGLRLDPTDLAPTAGPRPDRPTATCPPTSRPPTSCPPTSRHSQELSG